MTTDQNFMDGITAVLDTGDDLHLITDTEAWTSLGVWMTHALAKVEDRFPDTETRDVVGCVTLMGIAESLRRWVSMVAGGLDAYVKSHDKDNPDTFVLRILHDKYGELYAGPTIRAYWSDGDQQGLAVMGDMPVELTDPTKLGEWYPAVTALQEPYEAYMQANRDVFTVLAKLTFGFVGYVRMMFDAVGEDRDDLF